MNVTVYGTTTCPYCNLVKGHLKKKEIDFAFRDVAEDPIMANKMVERSGQMGVPVTDINGTIIVGWNMAAIDEMLKKASIKD